MFAKLDIKDGYWRMSVEKGAEWNFAYILPATASQSIKDAELAIPPAAQMGWKESPAFFCAAWETARDVAKDRCASGIAPAPPVGGDDTPTRWMASQ